LVPDRPYLRIFDPYYQFEHRIHYEFIKFTLGHVNQRITWFYGLKTRRLTHFGENGELLEQMGFMKTFERQIILR
jgi:hypothetical protein